MGSDVAGTLGTGVLGLADGVADADGDADTDGEGETEGDGDGVGVADGTSGSVWATGACDGAFLVGVGVGWAATGAVAAHAPLVLRDPYPMLKALKSVSTVRPNTTKYLARPSTMRPPCLIAVHSTAARFATRDTPTPILTWRRQ